jgi:hypothetical protein
MASIEMASPHRRVGLAKAWFSNIGEPMRGRVLFR